MILRDRPTLNIRILDDFQARLTLDVPFNSSGVTNSTGIQYRLRVKVMGEDGGFRGADDLLDEFPTDPFDIQVPSRRFQWDMQRFFLNEDKPHGARRKARRRRDRDEIYIKIQLEVNQMFNSSGTPRWRPFEHAINSNVVGGNRF